MKLATISLDSGPAPAIIDSDAGAAFPLDTPATMLDLISSGNVPERPAGPGIPLSHVKLLAPIPRPRRNIFCIGKNYFDHAHEFTRSGFDSSAKTAAQAVPKAPIVFSKVPECVIGPGDTIRYPHGVSSQVDYEAELAVVLGPSGSIFGYTIVNDVTARDLQAKHAQWLIGKSLDTFCPMGPWIVTADEVDAADLRIRSWINGEPRQDASTSMLIFPIPTLIATISAGITLCPGDIIATGTPAGVGIGFDPPKFLHPGDEIAIEIEGIGRLVNTIS